MSSWYYNKNLKPQGPISFEDMKKKVLRGEVSPGELICKDGESAWLPAMEWREFPRELFPAFQKNYFKTSRPDEKEWIVLIFNADNPEGVQQGPYSVLDVQEMIQNDGISIEDYIWRSGLSGWVQIKDRAEFLQVTTSPGL